MPESRSAAIEKLRSLVRHEGSSDSLREIAKRKLDILAPRRPVILLGAPRRRSSDATALAAENALPTSGGRSPHLARAIYAAAQPHEHRQVLDVLA
jgi:hypothetical protein